MISRSPRLRKFLDILTIIVLFIGAYFLYVYYLEDFGTDERWTFRREPKPRGTYEQMKEDVERQMKTDTALYNSAIESHDKKLCESIKNQSERERCSDMVSASMALSGKDSLLCATLSNTGIADRCRDNVAFSLAESENTTSKCSAILDENLRLQCIESIDGKILQERIASGVLNEQFCNTLSGTIQDRCIERVSRTNDSDLYQGAIKSKSFDNCDTIREEILRTQCRDTLTFEMAMKESDISLCSQISDATKVDYCKKSLSLRQEKKDYASIVASGDITACESLETLSIQHQCHDVILLSFVRNEQNPDLCENLYNTGMLTNCRALIRE